MTLPRRTGPRLGAWVSVLGAVLLAGIFGLAWWSWRRRPGRGPRAVRYPRTRAVLMAVGLFVIALGAGWRLAVAIRPAAECSPPGGPLPGTPLSARVTAEKAATWAETGIGILYSQADGAQLCFSRAQNYYVALNAHHIAGARFMTVGDVVLKHDLGLSRQDLKGLVEHEARHRTQWAVGTALGGPLAFPVAYGITYFFFPGARNPFERMAGLEAGGYAPAGTGPVLGPAQLAVLSALAVAVVAAAAVRCRRAARTRGQR